MREFQGERFWRRLSRSTWLLLGLIVLVGFLVPPVFRLYQKSRVISAERRSLLEEVERLKARQAELTLEVTKLMTERGVEEEIRKNFNVVKPGEKVISLLASATPTPAAVTPPIPWWQTIVDWFKFTRE